MLINKQGVASNSSLTSVAVAGWPFGSNSVTSTIPPPVPVDKDGKPMPGRASAAVLSSKQLVTRLTKRVVTALAILKTTPEEERKKEEAILKAEEEAAAAAEAAKSVEKLSGIDAMLNQMVGSKADGGEVPKPVPKKRRKKKKKTLNQMMNILMQKIRTKPPVSL